MESGHFMPCCSPLSDHTDSRSYHRRPLGARSLPVPMPVYHFGYDLNYEDLMCTCNHCPIPSWELSGLSVHCSPWAGLCSQSLELWPLVMTPFPTYTFVPGPDVLLGTSTAVLEGSGWFSSSQEAQRFLWALKATLVFQCHPTSWSSPQGI